MDEVYPFGTWLKLRRKELDLTRAELAQRLGCAAVTLQKIEQDERRPSKHMAERLADALDISPAERSAFLRSARGELAVDRLAVDTHASQLPDAPWANARRPRHNLPAQLTSFIGREREVNQILGLLLREDIRLLTLTGAGGTGKTRLSVQVASCLRDGYTEGVWFVDLASIRDPAVVPSAIGAVLGIREVAGQPLLARLLAYLAGKHMLLILDNFEQVLAAAPLTVDLLSAAPGVKIMVTSRNVLDVYGEQIVAVPTLELSDLADGSFDDTSLDRIAQSEAVALFLARAHAANPTFALTPLNARTVIEICRHLDGLPLAIELAAARSRLLTPQALLQRLDSRLALLTGGPRTLPIRQQTLRNTIDWSHDLLTPSEQVLFRRLAVFAGGWTVEAVQDVCTAEDIPTVDVLDGLASLGDKSLLRQGATPDGEPRFNMLETIREYALEHLVASGVEARVREQHAHYYQGWLEAMQDQYRSCATSPQQNDVVDRVREELNNLAATVEWIRKQGTWDIGLRWESAAASFVFVERLGWVKQAWKRWHQQVMDSRETIPIHTWVEALVRIASYAYWSNDLSQAVMLLEEGLAQARILDHPPLIVYALKSLGSAYRDQDMYARAAPLLEETMARAQQSRAPFDIAAAHHCLGELALLQEDYPRALEQAQASLPIFRALGIEWGIWCALINQGFAALHLGNDDLAARCFPEALTIAQLYDGGSHIRGALAGFSAMAAREGPDGARRAARLLGAIVDGSMVHAHRRACERLVAAARVQGDETAWEAAYAEGRQMTIEQAIAYAMRSDEPV